MQRKELLLEVTRCIDQVSKITINPDYSAENELEKLRYRYSYYPDYFGWYTLSACFKTKMDAETIKEYLGQIQAMLDDNDNGEKDKEIETLVLAFNKYLVSNVEILQSCAQLLVYTLMPLQYQVLRHLIDKATPSSESLPIEEKSVPLTIQNASKQSYEEICAFNQNKFITTGRNEGGDLNKNFCFLEEKNAMVDLDTIIDGMLVQPQEEKADQEPPRIIDLGTGRGVIVMQKNHIYKGKIKMQGVEAENSLVIEDKNILRGNVEDLPKVLSSLGRKPKAFISKFVFNFLSNPIKVICDAYDQLDDQGYLLLQNVWLYGLSREEANKMFEYLSMQDYELVTMEDQTAPLFWVGSILIKKNNKKTLSFPLRYHPETLDVVSYMKDSAYFIISRAIYRPNQQLKAYINSDKQSVPSTDYNKSSRPKERLQSWGILEVNISQKVAAFKKTYQAAIAKQELFLEANFLSGKEKKTDQKLLQEILIKKNSEPESLVAKVWDLVKRHYNSDNFMPSELASHLCLARIVKEEKTQVMEAKESVNSVADEKQSADQREEYKRLLAEINAIEEQFAAETGINISRQIIATALLKKIPLALELAEKLQDQEQVAFLNVLSSYAQKVEKPPKEKVAQTVLMKPPEQRSVNRVMTPVTSPTAAPHPAVKESALLMPKKAESPKGEQRFSLRASSQPTRAKRALKDVWKNYLVPSENTKNKKDEFLKSLARYLKIYDTVDRVELLDLFMELRNKSGLFAFVHEQKNPAWDCFRLLFKRNCNGDSEKYFWHTDTYQKAVKMIKETYLNKGGVTPAARQQDENTLIDYVRGNAPLHFGKTETRNRLAS